MLRITIILLLIVAYIHALDVPFGIYGFKESVLYPTATIPYDINEEIDTADDSRITATDVEAVERCKEMDGYNGILIRFTPEGAAKNLAFTTKKTKKYVAIVVNGKVVSHPMVVAPSSKETVIMGKFTDVEIQMIIDIISKAKKAN